MISLKLSTITIYVTPLIKAQKRKKLTRQDKTRISGTSVVSKTLTFSYNQNSSCIGGQAKAGKEGTI